MVKCVASALATSPKYITVWTTKSVAQMQLYNPELRLG